AGVSRDNLLTITSAVEARRYGHPPPDDARRQLLGRDHRGPLIGVIAQLIDRKGHRFLLRALPGLREAYPDLAVVFLGRGALRETLEAEVDAAGLAGCVHFAGFREDLAGLLPALDLVVHPALMEGLGVSLLEAAAASVPVVGFAAGGVMEAVANEHSGLLVESGDAIALGAAIGRLLGDPELRKRMGDNARRRVEAEFSIEVMVNRYAALYDVLAGEIE
ncbi:MAG: glycosyltransferase, partial [Pseudomonadota bacterium]